MSKWVRGGWFGGRGGRALDVQQTTFEMEYPKTTTGNTQTGTRVTSKSSELESVLSWTGGSPGRFWAMMVKAECGGRGSLNGWIFQPRVCPLCSPDEWKRVWGWWRLLMGSDSSANPCLPNVCQLGSSNCYWSLREACRRFWPHIGFVRKNKFWSIWQKSDATHSLIKL